MNRANLSPLRIADKLFEGRLIERNNRFLGTVMMGERRYLAFIPNPGRMYELLYPGAHVRMKANKGSSDRKTRFDLVAAFHNNRWVSIDSRLPNIFIKHLLIENRLPHFKNYKILKIEVKYSNSRFDFLVQSKTGETCYLEVKSCTLVEEGIALFPDAPTLRGQKHLRELAMVHSEGYRAAVLIHVQRDDADYFRPNKKTDPSFAKEFWAARDKGVEAFAISSRLNGLELEFVKELPIVLDNKDL